MPLRVKSTQTSFSTNLTKSARQAQGAIRSSLAELTPPGRAKTRDTGLTSTRARLTSSDPGAAARATSPSISFTLTPTGALALPSRSLKTVARHEVSHFAAGVPQSRQHLTIKAAGAQDSPSGLRRVSGVARLPINTQVTMALKRAPKAKSGVGTTGFSTPQLRKTATTGSASQSATARTQMRKLGARLKGKVDF